MCLIVSFISVWTVRVPAQTSTQSGPATARADLTGTVKDAAGKPVGAAGVTLHTQGGKDVTTVTDELGRFTLSGLVPGSHTVSAESSGLRSAAVSVVLRPGDSPRIELFVGPAPGEPKDATSQTSAATRMEFLDRPTFSIAGVADWTAVGGHGSDATLRTSEDLAHETMTLQPHANERTMPAGDEQGRESARGARLQAELAANPRSYAANRELGEFYLHSGRYEQALAPLQAASDLDQAKAIDEFSLALACRGIGDFAEARRHVAHALAKEDDASFHRVAGELDEKLGDPIAAVQQEGLATRLKPTEENYFAWGSELLLHRAIWQAVEVFRNGVSAHPSSVRMRTGWGAALFAGARYDEAAQRLCEAADLDPADSEPYLLIGKVLLASPAPLTGVNERLARFAAKQPDRADANYFYAMSLLKQGGAANLETGESLLKKAVAIDANYADANLQLGILAFSDRRYADAIDRFRKALQGDPQLAEAHYRLGVAYDRTGRPEEARQEFQRHDALVAAQAEKVEQERRQVKQFVVVLEGAPATK